MLDAFRSLLRPAAQPAPVYGRLDAAQAAQMLGKPGVLFVDVRERYEYDQGHIKGARLIPLGEVLGKAGELAQHGDVVIVCRSGNRSSVACRQLSAMGLGNLHNLEGGMIAWSRAGHKVSL